MRAKKSSKKSHSLISPTGLIKLMTHAMMGAALGLAFGLALILSNPAVANLLNRGGSPAVFIFVITLDDVYDWRHAHGHRVHPVGGQGNLKCV